MAKLWSGLLVLGIALAFTPNEAYATIHNLTATLDGSQANAGAGTGSPGTGFATVTYDDSTGFLSWNASWSGLSGTVTVAHFHGPALPNQNAGIQVGISVPSPSIGSASIIVSQANDLLDGLWYLNVHSTVYPGGEIRGQVQVSVLVTTTTSTTTTTLPALCGGSPIGGCRGSEAGKSQLQIKLKASDPSKNQLKFKYKKGDATLLTEFSDPVSGSADYRLCIWDGSAATQPLLEAAVLPGGTCGTKPCWKATGTKGFKFKDKTGTPNGIQQVKLKADGTAGKTQVQVKAKGLKLSAPTLPLTTTVTAQFVVDDGAIECWEVPMSATLKNDTVQFKAKGD